MPRVQSSAVQAIDYHPPSRTLFVIFTDGDRYAYFDTPPELYAAFQDADSKGRFFAEHVRDRFSYHPIR